LLCSYLALPLSQECLYHTGDPDLPAFYFGALINPTSLRGHLAKNAPLASHEGGIFRTDDADDDDFVLLCIVEPFLEDKDLEKDCIADRIALWWVPESHSRHSGRMKSTGYPSSEELAPRTLSPGSAGQSARFVPTMLRPKQTMDMTGEGYVQEEHLLST